MACDVSRKPFFVGAGHYCTLFFTPAERQCGAWRTTKMRNTQRKIPLPGARAAALVTASDPA
jgi:hypothetical protein